MGTITQSNTKSFNYAQTSNVKSQSAYAKLIDSLHFSYFGLITVTILVGSMLGSIAAMYILKNDAPIWELGACMAVAMTNNVMAIGQAPTKWVVNAFLLNVIVNVAFILAHAF
jgi:hypothetical protein